MLEPGAIGPEIAVSVLSIRGFVQTNPHTFCAVFAQEARQVLVLLRVLWLGYLGCMAHRLAFSYGCLWNRGQKSLWAEMSNAHINVVSGL